MVSKCANPKCSANFRYLREGRLFHFEATAVQTKANGPIVVRSPEFFWLCESCASRFTVVTEDGNTVVRPLKSSAAAVSSQGSAAREVA